MKKRHYISASEVSEFVFCRLSWALKYQQGLAPNASACEAQNAGEVWHARQGKQFARPRTLETVGVLILLLGVITVIVLWLLMRWSE